MVMMVGKDHDSSPTLIPSSLLQNMGDITNRDWGQGQDLGQG